MNFRFWQRENKAGSTTNYISICINFNMMESKFAKWKKSTPVRWSLFFSSYFQFHPSIDAIQYHQHCLQFPPIYIEMIRKHYYAQKNSVLNGARSLNSSNFTIFFQKNSRNRFESLFFAGAFNKSHFKWININKIIVFFSIFAFSWALSWFSFQFKYNLKVVFSLSLSVSWFFFLLCYENVSCRFGSSQTICSKDVNGKNERILPEVL